MALRKLYIVLDCENDQEKEAVQQMLNELSNMRVTTGRQIVNMWPALQRNKQDLMTLFSMIRQGGVKSLLSVKGGILINKLAKSH